MKQFIRIGVDLAKNYFQHDVMRVIAPIYVKPYVKRGKNDAADAAAICDAMSRLGMRFVPIRSAEAKRR